MKYSVGNIVCLNDGRTVYIFSVDEKEQKYPIRLLHGKWEVRCKYD